MACNGPKKRLYSDYTRPDILCPPEKIVISRYVSWFFPCYIVILITKGG